MPRPQTTGMYTVIRENCDRVGNKANRFSRQFRRHIMIVLGLSCVIVSPITTATSKSTLDHIVNKIASVKNLISHDTSKRQHLQNALEKAETSSSNIAKHLRITEKNLKYQKTLLNTLKNNKAIYQNQLKTEQLLLDHQIQTAYMFGRQPYLKLLLSQNNSNDISRILMYYHFINQDRITIITNIQKILNQIQENQRKIMTQYQTLQTLQRQQKNQQTQLIIVQESRKQLMLTINKTIQTRQQRLDALMANKHQLEKMIVQVAHHSVRFPKSDFSKLHNRLQWPTRGHVLQIFGTKIEQSELKWGGVLIKAPEGQPVYAIANGKVVFAKWLSGYGLLLIVNHGNGYMTLYGRNHLLYKNVDDIVHRGDLMSTVGQTGGYQTPALYFAIRHHGKPINPVLFIRKESK